MKKRVKLFVGSLIMIIALSIPLVALASSYSSYISDLYSTIYGATRSYDGQNIRIDLTSTSTGGYTDTGTYHVALFRDVFGTDDYIGAVDVNRNGAGTGSWSSVGAGNYYFVFSKVIDNYLVDADPVNMYNY